MTAHHFFVDPSAVHDSRVEITGSEAHHAARVLRVRKGEEITVADGTGRICAAVVEEVSGDSVVALVHQTTEAPMPRPEITLCQALAKADRFETVVEKATEVGVRTIVPFRAMRSVVRWDARKEAMARQRWQAIALAAAKQSRAPVVPSVTEIASELAAAPAPRPVLILDEGSDRRLREVLPSEPPAELTLVVGPEGGLDPSELEGLENGRPASLGPRVLRTETAGLVAAALVGFTYGSLG